MMDAHVAAGAAVGTPFGTEGIYDFGAHNRLTRRVSQLGVTMLQHRLTAPPPEAYSLHRRLSGSFLVNMKLRARVPCKELFDEICEGYSFDDGGWERDLGEGKFVPDDRNGVNLDPRRRKMAENVSGENGLGVTGIDSDILRNGSAVGLV
jgi:hypothetical protein